jgi:hypothetical protein
MQLSVPRRDIGTMAESHSHDGLAWGEELCMLSSEFRGTRCRTLQVWLHKLVCRRQPILWLAAYQAYHGMTPGCVAVCTWQRILASHHLPLPFP